MVDLTASARSRTPVNRPLVILAASFLACFVAAYLVLTHHYPLAGIVAVASGAGLLLGTAQAARERDAHALFAEAFVDRTFDAFLLAAIAWAFRSSSIRATILALMALATSYLASYERARGESLRYKGRERLGYRAARVALLSLGLLTGLVEAALWSFLALTGSATLVRGWNVVRQERRA